VGDPGAGSGVRAAMKGIRFPGFPADAVRFQASLRGESSGRMHGVSCGRFCLAVRDIRWQIGTCQPKADRHAVAVHAASIQHRRALPSRRTPCAATIVNRSRESIAPSAAGSHPGASRSGGEAARSAASAPLVSVVVPLFRIPEPFLRANALSLRAQSFQNAEFLYVLDGPDPGALAVLRDVFRGDPRFNPVVLPENRGVSIARNTALERARGVYVTFVDADDILPPGTLSAYAHAAQSAPDLAIGPAFGFICSVANRLALFPLPSSDSSDLQWARFHALANASSCGKLYGPSIRSCRFVPDIRYLEDARFLWTHLATLSGSARLAFLSTPVYSVVERPGSVSRSPVSPEDLSAYFDSLSVLAETPLPRGAGSRTRRVRAVQLLLWAFVDAIHATPEAWAAALPHARGFLRAFRKSYAVPFLLRPLVRRRLSSPEAISSPSRLDNILLWDVYRWTTRAARAEPLLLSFSAIFCPPLYRRLVSAFHPLPHPSEEPA